MIPATMKLPKDFVSKLNAVKAKRPATIIQHILRNGHITTEEIKNLYGYNHPPRAVRDVREQGIPIETFRIKDSEGRTIAAYKFGNPEEASNTLGKTAGRTALSKTLKEALIEKYGAKCSVYQEQRQDVLCGVLLGTPGALHPYRREAGAENSAHIHRR